MKLSDSDKQLLELKATLADAVSENRAKSVELQSLSSAVESLTHELDASKVLRIFICCFCSRVYHLYMPVPTLHVTLAAMIV